MRLVAGAAAVAAALLLAGPGSAGKGGPTPDPLIGGGGVTAPGGAVRYVALRGGNESTTVAAIRVEDGRVVGFGTFRGTLGIPVVSWDGIAEGLSADGSRLVLASSSQRAYALRTTFVVIETKTMRSLRRIELDGHWAFDAVSPDGRSIYALRYGAPGSGHYSVRAIDAASGAVAAGAIVDEREPDEDMLGSPMTRTWSPNRTWAFTLYAKPNGTAFVHGLDTVHRRAVCLDLPWTGVGDAIGRVRLQVGKDGGTLFLREPGLGRLATIDLRSLVVRSLKTPT